jgi:hypothetical protein
MGGLRNAMSEGQLPSPDSGAFLVAFFAAGAFLAADFFEAVAAFLAVPAAFLAAEAFLAAADFGAAADLVAEAFLGVDVVFLAVRAAFLAGVGRAASTSSSSAGTASDEGEGAGGGADRETGRGRGVADGAVDPGLVAAPERPCWACDSRSARRRACTIPAITTINPIRNNRRFTVRRLIVRPPQPTDRPP